VKVDAFVKTRGFRFSVIPAKANQPRSLANQPRSLANQPRSLAGIQAIQYILDAPVSSTGQAYQVRHDDLGTFYEPVKVDELVKVRFTLRYLRANGFGVS